MWSRFDVTLQYLRTYVTEWFDQNPLGQIGVILMRDRLSETLIPMGGESSVWTKPLILI
jgi:transcription initiation factor TFIIH subunit 2